MQIGEDNISKIRGDGQQSRQHRGLHNFKDYAIYGRELFFQDNGRRPVENSEYVHAELFQVFQKRFQHFAYGISQKDTHFARHGDAVIHRQVYIVHSAGMRFFRRVAFYSRIRAIDEYEAERIPLKIQNRPERQLTEFCSSAFISVFFSFYNSFRRRCFSLSFRDGIAFCPTFLIYFWQNASPIRSPIVAKKTSLSLVFSSALPNRPRLNVYSSAFTTIVNYLIKIITRISIFSKNLRLLLYLLQDYLHIHVL